MKINHKILSIPPYISTSWKNVVSLHLVTEAVSSPVLIITLVNASKIEVPNLDSALLDATFAAHEKYLEHESAINAQKPAQPSSQLTNSSINDPSTLLINLPMRLGLEGSLSHFLQHNPESAESPALPPDLLEKINSLSKLIGMDNIENFPKPEPHCNCMHCQIMRVFHAQSPSSSPETEEEVLEEDLRFREWDIRQVGDNLFVVSNPFNEEEHYNIFLGSPVGCTCGESNCEHIRAVLNS